jgi:hypothetical protein
MTRLFNKPVFNEARLTSVRSPGVEIEIKDSVNKLGEFLAKIEAVKLKYPDYDDYEFNIYTSGDSEWGYESTISVYGIRKESDEDYEKRKKNYEVHLKSWYKQIEDDKKANEKKEKAEYLKLKAKYG